MSNRRTIPIMALILIAVLSAMLVRYTYNRRFPILNPEPFQARVSQPPPSATSLHFAVTLAPRTSSQTQTAIEKDCTYHIYYWIGHPELWPVVIVLGNRTYSAEEAARFYRDLTEDLPTAISAQLYTAILNLLYGESWREIEPTLLEANEWLQGNTGAESLTLEERERGIELLIVLERFNNGLLGPGPCRNQPATPSSARAIDMDAFRNEGVLSLATDSLTSTPTPWLFSPSSTPVKQPRSAISSPTPTTIPSPPPALPGTPTATRTPTPFITATRSFDASPTATGAPSFTPGATATGAPFFTDTPGPAPTETLPSTSTPTPVSPSATLSPTAPEPPALTDPVEPTVPVETDTPSPTETPIPSRTPRPSHTPRPSRTPRPL